MDTTIDCTRPLFLWQISVLITPTSSSSTIIGLNDRRSVEELFDVTAQSRRIVEEEEVALKETPTDGIIPAQRTLSQQGGMPHSEERPSPDTEHHVFLSLKRANLPTFYRAATD